MIPDLGAIILVGGLGTRLHPLSLQLAKPLMPLAGRAALQYTLQQLSQVPVQEVVLAAGYAGPQFEAFVAKCRSLFPFELKLIVEQTPKGTGGALVDCLEHLSDSVQELLVLNGDTFVDVQLADFLAFHRRCATVASLSVCQVENVSLYGQVLVENQRLLRFSEKDPLAQHAGLINAGYYLFRRDLLKQLPNKPASLERDYFPSWLDSKVSVGVYETSASLLDIGTLPEYLRANLLAMGGLLAGYSNIVCQYVSPTAQVDPQARLTGTYWIGERCNIQAGAHIQDSVVGSYSWVGPGSQVLRSILWDECRIGADCRLQEALLGLATQVVDQTTISRAAQIRTDLQLLGNCELARVPF